MSFFKDRNCYLKDYNLTLWDKILGFNYKYLIMVCLVVMMGITVLYSVGGGSFYPRAFRQTVHFLISLVLLYGIALSNLRLWMKYA